MWIMLNNAFISIVDKDCGPDELMVRARRPGDIEKLFPEMTGKIEPFTGSDYHYRAAIRRARIALVISEQILNISYSNFKDSVQDRPLHDAYLSVWSAMARLQPQPPHFSARGGRPLPRRRHYVSLFDDGMGGEYRPGAVIDADERLSPFEEAHVFATGHMPPEEFDPPPQKPRKRRPAKNTRGR